MLLKNISLLLLTIFLLGPEESSAQDSFKLSAQALKEGQLDESVEMMNELVNQGLVSKELYSNLGNAHFQLGDLGNAMLYYHKALKLDPHNSEIQASIETIREQLEITITEIPDFVLVTLYRNIVNTLNASYWSIFQILTGLFTLICLCALLFSFSMFSKKTILWAGIFSLTCSLLFGIFAYSKKQFQLSTSQGIVMQSEKNIYVSPDEISPVVAPVGSGNLVIIISELGEWYKVSLRDKDIGWIKKEEVAII